MRVVSLTSVLLIIIINPTLASLTTAGYVVPSTRKGVPVKRGARGGRREEEAWTAGSSGMEMKSDGIEVAVTSCLGRRRRCCWNTGLRILSFTPSSSSTWNRPFNRCFYLFRCKLKSYAKIPPFFFFFLLGEIDRELVTRINPFPIGIVIELDLEKPNYVSYYISRIFFFLEKEVNRSVKRRHFYSR